MEDKFRPIFIIIPDILMDLPPADRFVFGAVWYFEKMKGGICTASNKEIARIAKVQEVTVGRSLSRLESEGFISRTYKDDKRRNRQQIISKISLQKDPVDSLQDELRPSARIDATIHTEGRDHPHGLQISNSNKYINSEQKNAHQEVVKLFDYYKQEFIAKISDKPPIFNWGACERLAKPHIKTLGLKGMKELLDVYFKSNDKLYKENAYSLSCFLSAKIIHKLSQKKH